MSLGLPLSLFLNLFLNLDFYILKTL